MTQNTKHFVELIELMCKIIVCACDACDESGGGGDVEKERMRKRRWRWMDCEYECDVCGGVCGGGWSVFDHRMK